MLKAFQMIMALEEKFSDAMIEQHPESHSVTSRSGIQSISESQTLKCKPI